MEGGGAMRPGSQAARRRGGEGRGGRGGKGRAEWRRCARAQTATRARARALFAAPRFVPAPARARHSPRHRKTRSDAWRSPRRVPRPSDILSRASALFCFALFPFFVKKEKAVAKCRGSASAPRSKWPENREGFFKCFSTTFFFLFRWGVRTWIFRCAYSLLTCLRTRAPPPCSWR